MWTAVILAAGLTSGCFGADPERTADDRAKRDPSESTMAGGDGPSEELRRTIEGVTVRVLWPGFETAGSGVIIERLSGGYGVITNAHVVGARDGTSPIGRRFVVRTHDDVLHEAELISYSPTVDAAQLSFESASLYEVARPVACGTCMARGDVVRASGFPNWTRTPGGSLAHTVMRPFGEAFTLESGKITEFTETPLRDGYQVGYSSDVVSGMSGGGVFDAEGRVIGINGRSLYALDSSVYHYQDGRRPPDRVIDRFRMSSFAIPIDVAMSSSSSR